jgi:hypothetical protein
VEHADGSVFLAISLRNVGSGMAVLQGWAMHSGLVTPRSAPAHTPEDEFHPHTRDLYIPAGDIGMWQGALRNPEDPTRAAAVGAIEARETLTVELLYTDQIGGQRTITRFGLVPTGETWISSVTRHWYLEWDGPRPEPVVSAAIETVLRDRDAAERWVVEHEHASPGTEADAAAPERDGPAPGRERASEQDGAPQPEVAGTSGSLPSGPGPRGS